VPQLDIDLFEELLFYALVSLLFGLGSEEDEELIIEVSTDSFLAKHYLELKKYLAAQKLILQSVGARVAGGAMSCPIPPVKQTFAPTEIDLALLESARHLKLEVNVVDLVRDGAIALCTPEVGIIVCGVVVACYVLPVIYNYLVWVTAVPEKSKIMVSEDIPTEIIDVPPEVTEIVKEMVVLVDNDAACEFLTYCFFGVCYLHWYVIE